MRMNLVHPAEEHLASYMDALDRGWSADTHRLDARLDEMMRIRLWIHEANDARWWPGLAFPDSAGATP